MRSLLPTCNELVYDNYNFLAIGYAPNERTSDAFLSIAAASNGVSVSFFWGIALPDPDGLLLGDGKQTRFVRLPTADRLRDPAVVALIRAAAGRGAAQPAATGKGRTIIKSISAKQRPRRART